YPLRKRLIARSKWLSRVVAGCLYAPTAILIIGEVALRVAKFRDLVMGDPVSFRYYLYYAEQALFACSLVISAALFIRSFVQVGRQAGKRASAIVVRQHLKWVMWGMSVAATAFAIFYVPAYLTSHWVSSLLESISIAPFILVPLTLGYS